MKSNYLVLFCIFLFVLGCSKDKFEVNPTIRIKSYTKTVPENGDFNAILEFSQKNGKINGDTLTGIRHRYNPYPNPNSDTFSTILSNANSPIPDGNSAEFSLTLPYTYTHNAVNDNDTIDFQFALTDVDGRRSDTVRTGKIVILQ